jgi:hypothetical protein
LQAHTDALVHLVRAANIFHAELPHGHSLLADVHAARGRCLLAVGEPDKAHAAYTTALAACSAGRATLDSLPVAALLVEWGQGLEVATGVPRLLEALRIRALHLHMGHELVQSTLRCVLSRLDEAGRVLEAHSVRQEWGLVA